MQTNALTQSLLHKTASSQLPISCSPDALSPFPNWTSVDLGSLYSDLEQAMQSAQGGINQHWAVPTIPKISQSSGQATATAAPLVSQLHSCQTKHQGTQIKVKVKVSV